MSDIAQITKIKESQAKGKAASKSFRLYLGGFMAAGKTSVGRKLAELTGFPFVDTDDLVEAMAGMSVAEIFQKHGELYFRALEAEALEETFKLKNVIVGLGGGVLVNPENKAKIFANGTLIILDAAIETILKRASNEPGKRPLLKEESVAELMNRRREAYSKAHIRVRTDDLFVDEVAMSVMDMLADLFPEIRQPKKVETIPVKTANAEYPVLVGSDILASFEDMMSEIVPKKFSSAFLVSDPLTFSLFSRNFKNLKDVHLLPRGERGKSLSRLSLLYEDLARNNVDRKGLIVALGGGCVGDTAGFAASTWMRGIDVVHIPTTLIAQVDSAIGGKTAVNLPEGKNLVGTFHQPCAVIVDVNCLLSLPDEEFRQGMAEVIKYGLGEDREFLSWLSENRDSIAERDPEILLKMVKRCIELKASVVKEDERETTGARSRLNLGHTIAHGLEALQGYGGIKHGDAVAIGMVVATHLAVILELESKGTLAELLDLLEHFGLPTKPGADFDSILPYVMRDKKFVGSKPMFVLPRKGYKCEMTEVDTDLLKKAYERARGR